MSATEAGRRSGEAAEAALAALVERTTGLQPGRRLFHACNGLLFAWLVAGSGWPRPWLVLLFGSAFVILLTVDALRLADPRLNVLFFRAFLRLASPREHEGLASSTWYVAGVLLTTALFPAGTAGPAILVLALADPCASVIGRLWGRVKVGTGTLTGSAVFVVVATLVLSSRIPPGAALACAVFVAVVEALPWPLDDNLTIPLAAAGALQVVLG
ncbi:MAG: hypothetical protein KC645_05840 [Gemmatimonadetes bacterium]|nr:hypothetical protein [Gemmatimonadota bacterium]